MHSVCRRGSKNDTISELLYVVPRVYSVGMIVYIQRNILIAVLTTLAALSGTNSTAREFTSVDGKKINAEVLSIRGDQVVLKMGTKQYTLATSKFSKEDNEYFEEWKANEAKNRIPDLEVKINSGKSDRSDRNDSFDDRKGSFEFSVEILNEEQGFDLEDAVAELIVIGEDAADRRMFCIMQKNDFKISVLEGETFAWKGSPMHYSFDDSEPSRWGQQYHGFVFQIKNSSGKVIFTKTMPKKFEGSEDTILGFTEGIAFDSSLRSRGTARIYTN